ncbi:MAG: DUF4388 domain-containing protein [Chloroflexi bacterium]|nr:DUF4388 domain-containing protein [Chloroflexota bacterium]
MALRGNLRDFTITQLLNLINLASKTGTLVIDGASEQAYVSFREGKLAYARIGKEDGSLASVLYKSNKINANQYKAIIERSGQMSDKELGLLLINAGYVSRDDILLNLQAYFTDMIRRLFTWVEGVFRFEAEMLPPDDRINVRLDLENIIIEGSRQLRELEQLQDEIPSLDMALKFTDRPTEVEVRRIVYGLLQAGLVELVRPAGSAAPQVAKPLAPQEMEDKKNLVNKLIGRIRSL